MARFTPKLDRGRRFEELTTAPYAVQSELQAPRSENELLAQGWSEPDAPVVTRV